MLAGVCATSYATNSVQNLTLEPSMKWLVAILALALAMLCPVLSAQANGSVGPNVQFQTTWNMPSGYDELYDFQPANVTILEWWSTT